jgi:hypothetical protein
VDEAGCTTVACRSILLSANRIHVTLAVSRVDMLRDWLGMISVNRDWGSGVRLSPSRHAECVQCAVAPNTASRRSHSWDYIPQRLRRQWVLQCVPSNRAE